MTKKGRKKDPLPLTRVSTLVPFQYEQVKRDLGITWRQMIARGVEIEKIKEQSKNEANYYLGVIDARNKEIGDFRIKLHNAEQKIKELETKLEDKNV